MSHYLKNLLPTEERVTEAKRSAKKKTVRMNIELMHRYALFEKPIRCRGADGRTYDYQDENGKYVSHFISQDSPLLIDNLEPGVAMLVRVLHSKGYLTMGSCQGHEDSKFRWVIMVFPEDDQLKKFQEMVNSFRLPITWYNNFLNFKEKPRQPDLDGHQLSFTWDQAEVQNRSLENLGRQGYTEEELTRYLNIMFSRKQRKYHLVKMVVCSKMGNKSFFEKLKWKRLYNKREKVTDKLVQALLETDIIVL